MIMLLCRKLAGYAPDSDVHLCSNMLIREHGS